MKQLAGLHPAKGLLFLLGLAAAAQAQQVAPAPASPPVGAAPPAADAPRLEFAFEFRVTLAPPVVVGDTPSGRRQYIPITGGRISGPKLSGEIVPGGWDYQLALANGCSLLSADYFIRAADGTVIHVLNEGPSCNAGNGERNFFRPRFEAPRGPYEWLNRSAFLATLELERPASSPGQAAPPLGAIRLRFYQAK